jgi:hypothetical protein
MSTCCYLPVPARLWSRMHGMCDNTSAQQRKGNVLQHRTNMSGLTRAQRYANAMRGTNRRRAGWATQSDSHTKPNMQELRRVGAYKIAIDKTTGVILGPTDLPLTCPGNNPSSNSGVEVVLDGGTLVCGSYENPCTGAQYKTPVQPSCHPPSMSDVPGPGLLCWTKGTATWIPRVRRALPPAAGMDPAPTNPISAIRPCE